MLISCASPEDEGARVANELIAAQTALREARIGSLNSFLEHFDPARFLDRKSARESVEAQLNELQKGYEAKKKLIDSEYEEIRMRYAKNTEKQALFESTYYSIVFAAPAIISDKEEELRRACDEIILKIIPPVPTTASISKDLMGQQFKESCENGYFPDIQWIIEEGDILDVEILECKEEGAKCSYKILATINKQSVASWIAELLLEYALGKGDEWEFQTIACDNVMPQITDTINESITHSIESGETEQVLVIKNNSNKKIVVGGATTSGKDDNWYKFSIFIAPHATGRIDGAVHNPTADYRIDFVEIG